MFVDAIQTHILTVHIDSQPIRDGVCNIGNFCDFSDLKSHSLKHHVQDLRKWAEGRVVE